MEPTNEHTFYAWLIVIIAVCIVTLAGAVIDSYCLNRRIKPQQRPVAVRRRTPSDTAGHRND